MIRVKSDTPQEKENRENLRKHQASQPMLRHSPWCKSNNKALTLQTDLWKLRDAHWTPTLSNTWKEETEFQLFHGQLSLKHPYRERLAILRKWARRANNVVLMSCCHASHRLELDWWVACHWRLSNCRLHSQNRPSVWI